MNKATTLPTGNLGPITPEILQLKKICRRNPKNHHAITTLAHLLHRSNRNEEVKEVLAVEEFRLGRFWRFLGRYVHARYRKDGTVKNMWLLKWLFRPAIRLSLAAMDRARHRSELMVGILGDEKEFIRLLGTRRMIQNDLLQCLGLAQASVRYMANYWVRKIGHLGQIEFYYKSLKLGLLPPHRLIIICNKREEIANPCLLDYWKQYIEVIIDRRADKRLALESRILNADIHLFESVHENPPYLYHKHAAALAWHQWESEKRPPLFSLEALHQERGWATLQQAGLPQNAWFVAFHIRESGFADDPGASPRNASIENYLPAMREVIARGGWVIRLGDKGMKPLPKMQGLVDYAHSSFKSDWMDVFLLAACRCFVGVASGPSGIPPLFGVPCIYTNWMPMADYPFHGNALLIHKTHRDGSTGEKALYSRIVSICTDYGPALDRHNLVLEENTAEEISDVVIEMLDRLDDNLLECPENLSRQARFRQIAGIQSSISRPALGRKFLESNADLL